MSDHKFRIGETVGYFVTSGSTAWPVAATRLSSCCQSTGRRRNTVSKALWTAVSAWCVR